MFSGHVIQNWPPIRCRVLPQKLPHPPTVICGLHSSTTSTVEKKTELARTRHANIAPGLRRHLQPALALGRGWKDCRLTGRAHCGTGLAMASGVPAGEVAHVTHAMHRPCRVHAVYVMHGMPGHARSCHVMPDARSCQVTSCHVMSHRWRKYLRWDGVEDIACRAVPCRAVPCRAVTCCDVL